MRHLITTTKGFGRSAFTLVELLLVILIIAVIASLGVGVMSQAQNDAAQSATRSRISLIERILETELEDYEVRRSPVPFNLLVSAIDRSSLDSSGTGRRLLHVKNFKRMILADLVRAEMPDGAEITSEGGAPADLGQFPSPTLVAYLDAIGLTDSDVPRLDTGWGDWAMLTGWQTPVDAAIDDTDEGAANKSELLYQILLNIDLDGVPAVEQIGGQSIGDTDGDSIPEIVDAWGEPIFLQWQQQEIVPVESPDYSDLSALLPNTWEPAVLEPIPTDRPPTELFVGLSKEHIALTEFENVEYCKPVLPTQIRPFLISERLIEIDGVPVDYNENHRF